MSDHFMKRNPDNEPVCSCGFRPQILDDPSPVGQQWKARTAVLDHTKALNDADAEDQENAVQFAVRFAEDVLGTKLAPWQEQVLRHTVRSPDAPFRLPERAKFPRAGVRRTADGRWLLSCWDADRIVHVIDEPIFDDRLTAFDYGYLTIGACRQSGTNLNGLEAS